MTAAKPVPVENRVVMLVDEIHALRNLPVLIAERLGYLRSDGMDVTVMNIRYDVSHRELLAAGRVDAVMAYYHHNFANRAQGLTTRAVITLGITPGIRVMVAEHATAVSSPTDLRGRRVITGGIKSAKSTVAAWLALNGGVGLDEFAHLPTRGREANAELLRSGAADLIVVPAHEAGYYESAGVATVLADLVEPEPTKDTLATLCPTSTIFMADDRIHERPDFAQHLATAFVRTLNHINTHSVDELVDLVPDAVIGKGMDRAAYQRQVEAVIGMFGGDGTMPADGAARECQVLQELHPPYRHVALADTYSDEFVLHAHPRPSVKEPSP
jgi:NitT/TauT family transport system substrate-binding protein